MNLDDMINQLRTYLRIFDDDSYDNILDVIQSNKNLSFSKYYLFNNIDIGLVESLASKCYYARLYLEHISVDDIEYLENICNDTHSNDMFICLLKFYQSLSDMTIYFDCLDFQIAARDYYNSYNASIYISMSLLETLEKTKINDEVFIELYNSIIDIYNEKMNDIKTDLQFIFENSIENNDLFLFESTFDDYCILKCEYKALSTSEFRILLSRLLNRLDLISDNISINILKEIAPLLYKYFDSEIDLVEKEEILIRKVNERI